MEMDLRLQKHVNAAKLGHFDPIQFQRLDGFTKGTRGRKRLGVADTTHLKALFEQARHLEQTVGQAR